MAKMADGQKVTPFTLAAVTNKSPGFYELVGPLLSRREVVDELGSPVWDDDGKQWIVAVGDDGKAIGVVGAYRGTVCSFYVYPDHRGKVVGTSLLLRLMELAECKKATATERAVPLFAAVGFTETGQRGAYKVMSRA